MSNVSDQHTCLLVMLKISNSRLVYNKRISRFNSGPISSSIFCNKTIPILAFPKGKASLCYVMGNGMKRKRSNCNSI